MVKRKTGTYLKVSASHEPVQSFIPASLPPDPPIEWTAELRDKFMSAMHALGELNAISSILPDADVFLYTYIRKEAVLSSQIEGTQSSLSDLLMHEQGKKTRVPIDDVKEVSNYLSALAHARKRLAEGFPLSLRLIREMHAELLKTGRGSRQTPGEFRRTQNWIGGSRPGKASYVPPPAHEVMKCMGAFEHFLHGKPVASSPLEKAALTHVQFESIHPFLDGNGRIGRLLIALVLQNGELLKEPLLYLSLYFKQNRQEYYDRLQRVRTNGDWEGWLAFFADGIQQTASQAVQTAKRLTQLSQVHRSTIANRLGQYAGSALRVQEALCKYVLASVKTLTSETGLSDPTVRNALTQLESIQLVEEITGKTRDKMYVYREYYSVMQEGTEDENHSDAI